MARPTTHEDPVKLTLYVEARTRATAQEIAKREGISTSALFARLVGVYAASKIQYYVPPIKA